MKAIASVILVVILSGCGGGIRAPSLAPRPIEQISAGREPTPDAETPAAPVPADPETTARAAALLDSAKAGNAAFVKAISAAEAGRSSPRGSEAWVQRQQAISAADIARAPTLKALSDIDDDLAKRIDSGQETAALLSARTEIQALADAQKDRITAASAR